MRVYSIFRVFDSSKEYNGMLGASAQDEIGT